MSQIEEELTKAQMRVLNAKAVLRAAEAEEIKLRLQLYTVRVEDVAAMEMSHMNITCNGFKLLSLDYDWADGLSARDKMVYVLQECLREGTVVIAGAIDG